MKCIFPGANIKVFSKAIQALAKVGEELYLEPKDNELTLRTINSSKSAFASFSFKNHFFSFYKHCINKPNESTSSTAESDFGDDCKILLKSCLYLFRNSASAEKQVESCEISWDGGDFLIFELHCRFGVKRLHKLPIIECESLQPNFDSQTNNNQLRIQSSILLDAINNFQSSHETEISFAFEKDHAQLRNYADDDPDGVKSETIRTELSLSANEFDEYNITNECNITFCLRDLKALLGFAVALELPIHAKFEQNGAPVMFEISDGVTLFSSFVLSTLSIEECSGRSSIRSSNISSIRSSNLIKRRRERDSKMESDMNKSKRQKTLETDSNNIMDTHSPVNKDIPSLKSINQSLKSLNHNVFQEIENGLEENPNHDLIEASPPPAEKPLSDKIKRVFRRCFEVTFDPSQIPGHDVILAPNSSSEDENE